jgi:hypothetical protein
MFELAQVLLTTLDQNAIGISTNGCWCSIAFSSSSFTTTFLDHSSIVNLPIVSGTTWQLQIVAPIAPSALLRFSMMSWNNIICSGKPVYGRSGICQ